MTTRPEDLTEGYDKREARLIHAVGIQTFEPDVEAAHKEARRLATAIEALDQEVSSTRSGGGKLFQLGRTSIRALDWPTLKYANRFEVTIYLERGDLVLAGRIEEKELGVKKIPNLFFNPIENRFEGTEYDASIAQDPGNPRAKRAALAVVMEAAFAALADVVAKKFKPDHPLG